MKNTDRRELKAIKLEIDASLFSVTVPKCKIFEYYHLTEILEFSQNFFSSL